MLKKLLFIVSFTVLFSSCGNDDESDIEIESGSGSGSGNVNFTINYLLEGEKIQINKEGFLTIQPGDIEIQLTQNENISLSDLDPGDYTVSDTDLEDFTEPTPFTIENNTTTEVIYNVDFTAQQIIELIGGEEYLKLIENLNAAELLDPKLFRLNTYSLLQNIFDSNNYTYNWSELGSDTLKARNGNSFQIDNYLISTNQAAVYQLWIDCYSLINSANLTIEKAEEFPNITDIEKNNIIGEMRFLRALSYFLLVKTYNKPVLITASITNPEEFPSNTATTAEIYEVIIDDLKFAQAFLIEKSEINLASAQAANALLGKVYLQMTGAPLNDTSKYSLALEALQKVENKFQLETNYSDVFSVNNENTNSETIFSIAFDSQNESENNLGNYGNGESWFGPLGDGSRLLEENFINSYFETDSQFTSPINFPIEVADTRFYQNIITYSSNGSNLSNPEDWTPNKFTQLETLLNGGDQGVDFPYLRYADILLMIAEAENGINGPTQIAYDAVNLVRRRAFGDNNHDLSDLTQNELLEAIIEERRLELCYEGHRKDDLVRTGKLAERIEYINTNYGSTREFSDHESIWPIPQLEIDNTGGVITQNPGY